MYFFRWSTPDSRTTPPSVSTFPFHITFTSLSICLVAKKTKPKFLNIVFDNFSMSKQGIFFLKYEVFGDEIFWIYYVLHMWSRLMVFILVASIFVFFRTEERSHFHYLYLIVAWFWYAACKAKGLDLRVHFKVFLYVFDLIFVPFNLLPLAWWAFGFFFPLRLVYLSNLMKKSKDILPLVNGSLINFREISCTVIGWTAWVLSVIEGSVNNGTLWWVSSTDCYS